MAYYHLSYDVKDSKKTDTEKFRRKVVKCLLDSTINATGLKQPVATTITFHCGCDFIALKPKIQKCMGAESFYILSRVWYADNCVHWDNQGNPELQKDFNKLVEEVKAEIASEKKE